MATFPKERLGLESCKKGWGTSIMLLQGLGELGFKKSLKQIYPLSTVFRNKEQVQAISSSSPQISRYRTH